MRLGKVLPAVVAVGLMAVPAEASAAADIEHVWSFTGGQVAIQAQSDGSFLGTVIRATRFSQCTHEVGERMWTEVRAQPDASYWGKHQWFNTSTCAPLPNRGNTAYRVLTRPDGSQFLRVCFAKPETPEIQPKIAPDGTSTDVNADCSDSDAVIVPPGAPTVKTISDLPSNRRCRSRRSFRIHLREPPGDALSTAVVQLNGRKVATRRLGRITAPVNLRGLPRGTYTVRIVARTVLGRRISGKRTFHTCVPKRTGTRRHRI